MERVRYWLKTYQWWIGICALEPLGIAGLIALFNPYYMGEFLSKAGFEAFAIGSTIQLIGIGFVIPYSEVKSTGWSGKLLKGLFFLISTACIALTNLIYTLAPAYFHIIEHKFQ